MIFTNIQVNIIFVFALKFAVFKHNYELVPSNCWNFVTDSFHISVSKHIAKAIVDHITIYFS